MINEFYEIVEKGIESKDVSIFGKYVEGLCAKYGVSEKTLYTRFKSAFGDSPRGLISQKIYPSEVAMASYVLTSKSSGEVREKTGLSQRQFVGIYDKYFGVSTFQKARLVALNNMVTNYNPVREDNRSIIYSQLLGDGSYDKKRHALRIIHGEKQLEYLNWKVSLLCKAYPKMSKKVSLRQHKQGHLYGDYYTPLGNIDIPSEADCVSKLTNLGWLLWWLDDGTYAQNISICCERDGGVRHEAVKELSTYGIKAREDGTSIIVSGQENDLLFYKNFIEPFKDQIPSCMSYKVEDIVGRVVI